MPAVASSSPATISFGQAMPEKAMRAAVEGFTGL
jgi:hypothetical protein